MFTLNALCTFVEIIADIYGYVLMPWNPCCHTHTYAYPSIPPLYSPIPFHLCRVFLLLSIFNLPCSTFRTSCIRAKYHFLLLITISLCITIYILDIAFCTSIPTLAIPIGSSIFPRKLDTICIYSISFLISLTLPIIALYLATIRYS